MTLEDKQFLNILCDQTEVGYFMACDYLYMYQSFSLDKLFRIYNQSELLLFKTELIIREIKSRDIDEKNKLNYLILDESKLKGNKL